MIEIGDHPLMRPKRSKRFGWAVATIVLITVTGLILFQFDSWLRMKAHERESYFVALHFAIRDEVEEDVVPPENLSQIKPIWREGLLKPFHGNISLRKTGERSFILEEPQEQRVSLLQKDRMIGDENGTHWLRTGVPLIKHY